MNQKEKEKSRKRRLRNLIFGFAFLAVFLGAATFAWFIGMRTVNVTPFDIEIAAVDQLSLSLDGATWSDTITINATNLETVSYTGHTNKWAGRGLIPVSTIGEMDDAASRMMLFEKASLTSTAGGYRLLTSRVPNYDEPTAMEPDGYVVFDLFIRNLSGRQYIAPENILDEEAIYLTTNSQVTVSSAGVAGTGIENSVRVAFAQIGRVEATQGVATAGDVTGITCNNGGGVVGLVTGLCREAQIWEPNDRAHTANAINWYEQSCRERTVGTSVEESSYTLGTFNCNEIIDGIWYNTYAVTDDIASSNAIDIYDGADYNKFTRTGAGAGLLEAHKCFTDSHKDQRGIYRPTFMTLAPNSITKVRIYVYIEGQDIDNYDFAAIGKAISVNFGFTKERYTEDDVNYSGPDLNQGSGPGVPPLRVDRTPPIITIVGDNPVTTTVGTYTDWADFKATGGTTVSARDNLDNPLGSSDFDITDIEEIGTVNFNKAGTYIMTYRVVDAGGNVATKQHVFIINP